MSFLARFSGQFPPACFHLQNDYNADAAACGLLTLVVGIPMRTLALLLAGLWGFAAAGCGRVSEANVERYTPPPQVALENNRFALALYKQLSQESHDSLFISLYSISTAMAMTYAGAKGETAEQIAKTLDFTLPPEQFHSVYGAMLRGLPGASRQGCELRVANRLWGQEGYKFLAPFLQITKDDYGAELAQLDFVNHREAARETINSWTAKQTDDKITDAVGPDSLAADTRLVLTNAIYFKGQWAKQFSASATHKAAFHVSPERSVEVEMMRQSSTFDFKWTQTADILQFRYVGGDLAMDILLPRAVDGLGDLEKSLTLDSLRQWLSELNEYEVVVWLPRFTLTREIDLKQALSTMGMPLAFLSKKADLSGMDGSRDLFIAAALHKASVNVNEEGTEAAAVTHVQADAKSAEPPPVLIDHPFIFLIRDLQSDSILFMGRYLGPD